MCLSTTVSCTESPRPWQNLISIALLLPVAFLKGVEVPDILRTSWALVSSISEYSAVVIGFDGANNVIRREEGQAPGHKRSSMWHGLNAHAVVLIAAVVSPHCARFP